MGSRTCRQRGKEGPNANYWLRGGKGRILFTGTTANGETRGKKKRALERKRHNKEGALRLENGQEGYRQPGENLRSGRGGTKEGNQYAV